MEHPALPTPEEPSDDDLTQPQPTCLVCHRRIRRGPGGWMHIEHADHVAVGPGPSTSVVVDLSGVVDAIVDSLIYQLSERGVQSLNTDDDRNGPFVPPQHMPPRGTVTFGEVTE